MSDPRSLRDTAELFVKLAADAGRTLEFDESGVAWAAQYVETIRPVERPDQRNVQAALVGSFLGEAIVAVYGGAWDLERTGEWSVAFPSGKHVHPFRQTLLHLDNGAADSILGLWVAVPGIVGLAGAEGETGSGTGDASPDDPAAVVRETAEKFRDAAARAGGPTAYGEEMVEFLDQYLSNAPPIELELRAQFTALIGAVLGECLVAAYGGEWRAERDAWAVHLPRGVAIYPFAAARQRIEEPDASLAAVFRDAAG